MALHSYLDDWALVQLPNQQGYLAVGRIHADCQERFADGTLIHTSPLVRWDKPSQVLATGNSVYHLRGAGRLVKLDDAPLILLNLIPADHYLPLPASFDHSARDAQQLALGCSISAPVH
ncbi:hypothetical protein [Ferrimonas marina]|uniref:Uncharacterized protein n=1 Tax=Ferrimonas marina TaxID=299255 RepID=A0A1M5U205_9GAMM|nr:hypothetical protein [Ferrimonas marina]SHH57008.1 hypothetical protein SAMN02745129_2373 [Ferrimonas marina]